MDPHSVEKVVQQQLDAYNARNLDAWAATYAADAQQFEYPDTLLAEGIAQIRERAAPRFTESNLHAKLIKRSAVGNIVVDHEMVTRTFAEGAGQIELLCIYEIKNDRIQKASFVFGAKTLMPDPA